MKDKDLSRQLIGTVLLSVIWTSAIATSIIWNIHNENIDIREHACIQARVSYYKDVIFRRWNSMLHGVYAPVSSESPPNKYLEVPDRDITLPSGRRYTLINPAYMTRQIHELQQNDMHVFGHITSLKPIRPRNAADPWETKALMAFERGEAEVSSVEMINNRAYMRLMRPLITEESCMRCHAKHGYRLGDIRGGISVSVPMAPLVAIAQKHNMLLAAIHVVIWFLGLFGVMLWSRSARNRIRERKSSLAELHIKETAIANSSNGIVLTDLAGNIFYCNNAFRKMWGYADDADVSGESIFSFIKVDEPEEVSGHIAEFGSWFGELFAIKYDGSEFIVLMSSAIIKGEHDQEIGMTFSFSDITMRKNIEKALRESEENLRQRNIVIERELMFAELVQRELMFKDVPSPGYLDIQYRYFPVEKISGDFFTFFPYGDSNIGIFICDVSGHGVASALFHSLIKSTADRICKNWCHSPADYIYNLNHDLRGYLTSYFLTGIYGTFQQVPDTGGVLFTFSNGGHPPPLLMKKNGDVEIIDVKGTLIGVTDNFTHEQREVTLSSGDMIFFYTDGIPETENKNKEIIGYDDQLIELFKRSQQTTLGGTLDGIIEGVNRFKGDTFAKDDMLVIGIAVK